jgi:hypothetical protein
VPAQELRQPREPQLQLRPLREREPIAALAEKSPALV